MFNVLSLATIALSAVSAASGLAIPRATKPDTYAEGYLENYQVYHKRYMALQCNLKHNTQFFDACCHPMLATETLAKNRAPECNPANQTTSAAPQSTEDCDEEPAAASDAPSPSSSASPVATAAPINVAPDPPVASAASSTHEETPAASSKPVEAPPATHTEAPPPPPTHTEAPPPPPSTPTKHTSSPAPSPDKPSPPPPPPAAPTSKPPSIASTAGDLITGGFATFFYQNGVAGACGKVNPDSALIAAMDQSRYGNSGNESGLCGKQVEITNTKNGKKVTVIVADDCPTCENSNSIDLSVGAFTAIATKDEGMVPIEWRFL